MRSLATQAPVQAGKWVFEKKVLPILDLEIEDAEVSFAAKFWKLNKNRFRRLAQNAKFSATFIENKCAANGVVFDPETQSEQPADHPTQPAIAEAAPQKRPPPYGRAD